MRAFVFTLDAAAAGQQQWRQFARDAARLYVVAAAVHAQRVGQAPCRLFVALLRNQRWEVILQEDEDHARRLLREHRDGPCPRTILPAVKPEVPLPDDARFVLLAEQVLRQAGWQGDPFLGVKLHDPSWTRERWNRAQAALGQWQQAQARWEESSLEPLGACLLYTSPSPRDS